MTSAAPDSGPDTDRRSSRSRGVGATLRPAGLLRRLPALAVDLLPPALSVALLFATNILERSLIAAPPGWFWSEWWLTFWLDHPSTLWTPLLVFALLGLTWNTAWELAAGRTPGAMALRLRVVDQRGLPIGQKQALLRGLGAALNVLTLGLGYLLIAASARRRGLHDWISGSAVVRV